MSTTGIHYYDLQGSPAKWQDFFYAPARFALDTIYCAQEETQSWRIVRLANFIFGTLTALISSPLTACGYLTELCYREKIDPQTFQNESTGWLNRFQKHTYTSVDNDVMIKLLIQSGKSVSSCPFHKILCTTLLSQRDYAMFDIDGRQNWFAQHLDNPADCLIIGAPKTYPTIQKLVPRILDKGNATMSTNFKERVKEVNFDKDLACVWIQTPFPSVQRKLNDEALAIIFSS